MRSLFNNFKLLKIRFLGSTLLETVVASVIFMIIFGIAMDILPRILISNNKDNENLLIESAFSKCQRELTKIPIAIGIQTFTFDWGEIQVTISPYESDLFKVEMNATTKANKSMSYRYITSNENTKE